MGTRGIVVFVVNGRKYAIYSQYDTYPSGVGQQIVNFIVALDDDEIETMAERVAQINWYNRTRQQGLRNAITGEAPAENVSIRTCWDTEGGTLESIFNGQALHWIDSYAERHDTLFTEFTYHIDLDLRRLKARGDKSLDNISFERLRRQNAVEAWHRKIDAEDE